MTEPVSTGPNVVRWVVGGVAAVAILVGVSFYSNARQTSPGVSEAQISALVEQRLRERTVPQQSFQQPAPVPPPTAQGKVLLNAVNGACPRGTRAAVTDFTTGRSAQCEALPSQVKELHNQMAARAFAANRCPTDEVPNILCDWYPSGKLKRIHTPDQP